MKDRRIVIPPRNLGPWTDYEGSGQMLKSQPRSLVTRNLLLMAAAACAWQALAQPGAPTTGHALYAQGFRWALCVDHFELRPDGSSVAYYISRPINPNATTADDRYGSPCKGSRGGEAVSDADIRPWLLSEENPLGLSPEARANPFAFGIVDWAYFYNSSTPATPSASAPGQTAYERYDPVARQWVANQGGGPGPTPTPTAAPPPAATCTCCDLTGPCQPAGCRPPLHPIPACSVVPGPTPAPVPTPCPVATPCPTCRPGVPVTFSPACRAAIKQLAAGKNNGPNRTAGMRDCDAAMPADGALFVPGVLSAGQLSTCLAIGGQP